MSPRITHGIYITWTVCRGVRVWARGLIPFSSLQSGGTMFLSPSKTMFLANKFTIKSWNLNMDVYLLVCFENLTMYCISFDLRHCITPFASLIWSRAIVWRSLISFFKAQIISCAIILLSSCNIVQKNNIS
jgi:hypothetical protein